MSHLEAAHKKKLDAALNRSGALALKKNTLQKEKHSLARRVEELEELKNESEGKIEAQEKSQRYCEEAVESRKLKIKRDEQLAQIEVLKKEARKACCNEMGEQIQAQVEDTKEAGRNEIKDMLDPLIIEYNDKVLIHCDLSFLGEVILSRLSRPGNTLLK